MKKILLSVLITLFSPQFIFSQDVELISENYNQEMNEIDKTTKVIIDNISNYTKIEKINNIKNYKFVFLNGKELKVVKVKAIEDDIEKYVAWCYSNEELIYSETKWINTRLNKIIKIERCYLDKNHLIAWVDTEQHLVDKTSDSFKQLDKELVAYGIKLREESIK